MTGVKCPAAQLYSNEEISSRDHHPRSTVAPLGDSAWRLSSTIQTATPNTVLSRVRASPRSRRWSPSSNPNSTLSAIPTGANSTRPNSSWAGRSASLCAPTAMRSSADRGSPAACSPSGQSGAASRRSIPRWARPPSRELAGGHRRTEAGRAGGGYRRGAYPPRSTPRLPAPRVGPAHRRGVASGPSPIRRSTARLRRIAAVRETAMKPPGSIHDRSTGADVIGACCPRPCENRSAGLDGARLIQNVRRPRIKYSPRLCSRFYCCATTTAFGVHTAWPLSGPTP
jgi:hypothetical protein